MMNFNQVLAVKLLFKILYSISKRIGEAEAALLSIISLGIVIENLE